MKKRYSLGMPLLVSLLILLSPQSKAQCVDGSTPIPVMMDTTIAFETGSTAIQVKFPQFDPEKGMLRCVKLTVTMIGVVDTVAMQNLSSSTQTASFDYFRNDEMSGPGLNTPLKNRSSKYYGPYSVTKYDGNFTTGTDHASISRDTVLRKTTTNTLTDSTEISLFYGHDSVRYDYKIDVSTAATISGGSSSNMVLTSALVRFRFEYCTCPKVALPLGLKNFTVTKTADKTANLYWEAENDGYNYTYDVEVSRDGKNFARVATVDRQYTANPRYLLSFAAPGMDFGRYYFRVRQRWQNGYVRFTAIKIVDFNNPVFETTSLYPNPSTGAVGLKFVNVRAGKMQVQVSNSGGQQVFAKEFQVAQTDYKTMGTLPAGMYWVKITDLATRSSCVKQLIVQ